MARYNVRASSLIQLCSAYSAEMCTNYDVLSRIVRFKIGQTKVVLVQCLELKFCFKGNIREKVEHVSMLPRTMTVFNCSHYLHVGKQNREGDTINTFLPLDTHDTTVTYYDYINNTVTTTQYTPKQYLHYCKNME